MGIYAVAVPEIIRMDRIVVTARKNVLVWDEISDIKAVEAIGTDGKVMSMEGAIVSYKSNNTDSVEVDGNGVLTAKEAGSAVITVTVELNRRVRTGEAVITVKELPVYAPALKTKTSDSVTLQDVYKRQPLHTVQDVSARLLQLPQTRKPKDLSPLIRKNRRRQPL